jgi:hypothetical protein
MNKFGGDESPIGEHSFTPDKKAEKKKGK